MDTTTLRWFQAVADGETVTELAFIYGVSQPGLSRALGRLEEEVGVQLLRRHGRRLRLTEAGAVFKRHVDETLHRLDDGLAALEELADPETGRVALGFQLSLGTWLVPALVRAFGQEHPRVTFRLEPSQDAVDSLVVTGDVDLELTSRPPEDPAAVWRPVLTQPLALAVPDGHALADVDEVALELARDEPFIALHHSWHLRSRTDELCARAGFEPRVAVELDDLPVVHGFVRAGLGVSIVPRTSSPLDAPGVRMITIADPAASREIGLSWPRERRLLPAAAAFRDFVLQGRGRAWAG